MRLAIRCARDSIPPLRLATLLDLLDHPASTAVSAVAGAWGGRLRRSPVASTALWLLGAITRDDPDRGPRCYHLTRGLDLDVFGEAP